MAKAISRNHQQIRYLCHSLASSQQWQRSSFHTLSNTLNSIKSLPLSPLAMRLDGLENGLISYRFLCTSSSSNQSNSGSGGSSTGANSEKSESSGGSQKTEQGKAKSIRGSDWFTIMTGKRDGILKVDYYDITNASTSVKQGPSLGKAAIGGPFSLIDHNGKPATEKDFFGKWTVVYFGFTHCPDICPDELQKLAAAVDKIKEKSGTQVVPLFISVDPERDTVEQVGEYVKEFHPNLIGLTGTPEEIKKTARAYRVYYMKTEEEGSDYLVDHSIVMYLMDPKMEFVKFFGKNNDVDMLTDGIIKEIKQYKQAKA